ncbi:sugar ABC transporter ATP-binding protein [Streptomyces ochraceiscleroticus]|uniref:Sugar ABC transporter ATP-binding protein n=1 Tax=Streptomyces ochraceiscleroticus TaxID=47761 RepID=A0ABW1MT00_9ACTN|nr:sugar ABC transporter ATP-binding protein [Streptomyces ochraceiscleroticus]
MAPAHRPAPPPPAAHEPAGPLLTMTGITKSFPGVRALDGVDLDVVAGEVHCLLGQNGAGKSTLIKVLAGAHQPDGGTIRWRGETVSLKSPIAAMRLGIATIYQELDLVEHMSVAENVFLGHERATGGFIRTGEARERTAELLARLGHPEIDPGTLVGRLSAAGQQIASMARALSHDVRLIVMDEPSAALDPDEVDNLFRIVAALTASGVAVVYISHRLEEIRRIGDRVTVLKDGRTAARGLDAHATPTRDIVALMTGRDVEYVFPERRAATVHQAANGLLAPVLSVEGLAREGEFGPVDFRLRPGEILGLAGLVGSGRSEILETVYGARRPTAGRVLVDGRPLRPGSVTAAVRAGLGLAPEERKSQALLLLESVSRNVSLSSLPHFARAGWLNRPAERAGTLAATRGLSLRPDDPDRPVRTLSGGNQQKAVLARWLLRGCRVLLLDEPTRGVDVGARAELYALIRRLADDGVAVLLVSSEVPEVLGLADRVLVLREGRVVHEGEAAALDEHRVLDLVMSDGPGPVPVPASGRPATDKASATDKTSATRKTSAPEDTSAPTPRGDRP